MSNLPTAARALVIVAAGLVGTVAGARQATEPVDAAMNARIRDEGLNRSQAGSMFSTLVDTIGPRLANSPAYIAAATWSRDQLAKWQLSNPRLEAFDFGRGWVLDRFSIEMIEPRHLALVGYPEAWSPSTAGEVVATVQTIAGQDADRIEQESGRLKGAAVLQAAAVENFIRADREQPTARPSDPPQGAGGPGRQGATGAQGGRGGRGGAQGVGAPTSAERINAALQSAGVAVLLRPSRGEHGTLFVQAGRGEVAGDRVPRVVLIGEHYNLLTRLAAEGARVRVRVNVQARFVGDRMTHNVVAEWPGADPSLRDQVVMLGAHLDSWHTAAGATDNADGVAAALEAIRILKAVGAQPRRTIRIALWGAEEQGLLGSRAYVAQHLAGDANAATRAKLSVYFNIDPGKGPIYGWFLQSNPFVGPIFDAWLAPFRDLGARRNVAANIGSTDHLSFINAGVPGFNPVQDYVNYDVREHHTNVDTPERIAVADLKQNAIILASFLYHAAQRDGLMPTELRR